MTDPATFAAELNMESGHRITPEDTAALWQAIRQEALEDANSEPLLSSFLYASVLSHSSFERSLAFVLSNRLNDATLLATELYAVFLEVLRSCPRVPRAALEDLCAIRARDPACLGLSQALLYFKGFHALQSHRIAHELWLQGRRLMASALQSRASEAFAVDIHPGARLGRGLLLDHGTGIVVGETAVVGDGVSILQGVTLGGTGKQSGDRHPKIEADVLIGASATVLGNIVVGQGAQVAAGSLVLKPVPARTAVAGSPARHVGTVKGNPAQRMDHLSCCPGLGLRPEGSRGEGGGPGGRLPSLAGRASREGTLGAGHSFCSREGTGGGHPLGRSQSQASRQGGRPDAGKEGYGSVGSASDYAGVPRSSAASGGPSPARPPVSAEARRSSPFFDEPGGETLGLRSVYDALPRGTSPASSGGWATTPARSGDEPGMQATCRGEEAALAATARSDATDSMSETSGRGEAGRAGAGWGGRGTTSAADLAKLAVVHDHAASRDSEAMPQAEDYII